MTFFVGVTTGDVWFTTFASSETVDGCFGRGVDEDDVVTDWASRRAGGSTEDLEA